MAWKQPPKPTAPKPKFDTNDDDWDTDITYQNSATEKSQRYGSASVPGSGRVDHFDLKSVQEKAKLVDQSVKEDFKAKNPTRGYGGKYGTEQVMDKAAQDFSYKAEVKKHSSQTDGKKGFGGEHGIDERAKDQSAVGFDYKSNVEKHSSQKDYTVGFGSKQDAEKKEPSASSTTTPPTPSAKPPATPPVKPPATPPAKPPATPPAKPPATPPAKPPATPPAKPPATPPAKPPATPSTPSAEPKVVEKPAASTTTTKADVGGIRARFENIKKEQEAEAAKRVAEERKKRTVTDQNVQQQQQSSNNTKEEVKKQEPAPAKEEKAREPSPERPKTPPALGVVNDNTSEDVDNTNIPTKTADEHVYENVRTETSEPNENENIPTKTSDEHIYENVKTPASKPTEENEEEPARIIGGINVSAILRQRKTSSSSSKNGDDDEWDDK